ncbi:hypothetical protein L1987_63681 [Smallanthus sonchifolius]|uniref:Uncharacterized protein n=1 Tax=Smallanthus sonchifolius TaxID=185202 RepID=A0ACB9CDZ3_9ASTR|nr:hypothetical protein L1987_63681 [Smallanthus sonchifolius]
MDPCQNISNNLNGTPLTSGTRNVCSTCDCDILNSNSTSCRPLHQTQMEQNSNFDHSSTPPVGVGPASAPEPAPPLSAQQPDASPQPNEPNPEPVT